MITITPQGSVYLCKTPLENDYKNQLTFTNANAQFTYFNSTVQKSFDNYTYIKKDNIIKVGVNVDEIIDCNYLFYRNGGFTSKWYYCFITDKEYINENVTALTIETDVFQTWQFQINYNPCFVEREHVNSDGYGEHTLPESLETGEYINDHIQVTDIGDSHIVICSTVNPTTLATNTGGTFGNVPSGARYYLCKETANLKSALNNLAGSGKGDAVISVITVPDFITGYSYTDTPWDSLGLYEIPDSYSASAGTGIAIPLNPTMIDGYTPKNKKLFTYPYYSFVVSNNQGGAIAYHIEDFYDSGSHTGGLNLYGVMSAGGSVRLIPENYKVTENSYEIEDDPTYKYENNEYGLTLGKLPVGSWSNDVYTNWLTQNGVSMALGLGLDWLNAESSITGLDDVRFLESVGRSMISVWQHSLVPRQAEGNINSGDVTYAHGIMTYTSYTTTIKQEYARIIDNYFDLFGYKVNSVKVPNITGRPYWNYVKTIGCNFDGDIPQTDLSIIKGMFDKGVTLWHSATNMYNYSLDNTLDD